MARRSIRWNQSEKTQTRRMDFWVAGSVTICEHAGSQWISFHDTASHFHFPLPQGCQNRSWRQFGVVKSSQNLQFQDCPIPSGSTVGWVGSVISSSTPCSLIVMDLRIEVSPVAKWEDGIRVAQMAHGIRSGVQMMDPMQEIQKQNPFITIEANVKKMEKWKLSFGGCARMWMGVCLWLSSSK